MQTNSTTVSYSLKVLRKICLVGFVKNSYKYVYSVVYIHYKKLSLKDELQSQFNYGHQQTLSNSFLGSL